MGFGAVILAAGLSSRMAPVNKLLTSLGDRPVIRHVVQTALDAGLDPATVVVGPDREALRAALEGLPVRIIGNDDYAEGLASSIRAGVAAVAADVDAALFLLGDMPLVAPRHVHPLLAAFAPAEGRSICIPTYRTQRGNPVLWSARYFPRLLELRGDQGARALFHGFTEQIFEVEMPDDAVLVDIDTQAALDAMLMRFAHVEKLYAQPILQLAREARHRAPLQRPMARATVLSNRFCGDEVRLEVRVEEGLIRDIACSVRACVLCEASALIVRQAMIGKDASSLAQAEQFMRDLAGGWPVTPPAGWEELGKFEPLRRFKSRLDCVLLLLRALRQALSDQRPTSASLSAW